MMNHFPFTPTPITPLPYYSKKYGVDLLCKRDDLFAEAGGGNKARMLQYILADINSHNCDVLLTAGGPCSNFNRACALMCAKLGVSMHLVEYTTNESEYNSSLNYLLCNLANIRHTRCAKTVVSETISKVQSLYLTNNQNVKIIYGGGRSIEGIYAYYDAVKELYKQNKNIDYIFVACGTGTTLTGICAGTQKYFPKALVYGISVARCWNDEKEVLADDMNLLNKHLHKSYNFDNLCFKDQYLCGGYGKYDNRLMGTIKECIAKEGLIVDPTYSGKALWGMLEIIDNPKFRNKNILFWNTGGIFNLLSQ